MQKQSSPSLKRLAAAQTILVIRPDIDKICEAISKRNLIRAMSLTSGPDETYDLMERIIDKSTNRSNYTI